MIFGSGGTDAYATAGDDMYTFNGKAVDVIHYTSALQSDGDTSKDTINGFDANADAFNFSAISDEADFIWTLNGSTLEVDLNSDSTVDMYVEVVGLTGTLDDTDFVWT